MDFTLNQQLIDVCLLLSSESSLWSTTPIFYRPHILSMSYNFNPHLLYRITSLPIMSEYQKGSVTLTFQWKN